MTIHNASKLIKDINEKKDNWDEFSQFKMKGCSNLSVADLDTLTLYAETYIQSNGTGFPGLMSPMGDIEGVLEAYGIKATSNSWF